jgi:cytochrome c oxidase subunit I+III
MKPADVEPLPEAPPAAIRRAQEARLIATWEAQKGWRYWSAVNNTEVGRWYIAGALIFFLYGGLLALMMRTQLAFPGQEILPPDLYNQVFTMHGSVMMFLFAVPIFEAVSILILPQMLGARDLPFPRLSAYGFWCYVIGGVFVCGSLLFGAAPAGGWFMYPPLTTTYQPGIGADIWLLGLSFIEVSSLAAAVELIVGVLKCRPPGMRINLIPLYAWYILVVAGMILFAFPPLIAGDILLELERSLHWPFFDPSKGGDPLLWQHLFWIFGHPEVYIIFLPSIALVAMIVPTFARRPIVGYSWIVLAAVGTGFLSFGLWVHHMYTAGLPGITLGFFSAASLAVAIPTGVQIFCFIATLMAGPVTRSVPLLYVFGGFATFVLGGLTGVMVAVAPFDFQAHDTYFVVAHLHSVLIGGTVFPLVAGLYYFYPMATGKLLSERLGRIAFWPLFVGFNLTFVPMHVTGLRGMPRRVATYPEGIGFDMLNLLSTIGAVILAAGFAIVVWDVIRPKGKQPHAKRNPWNAGTLEWLAEMPNKPWGVRSVPEIDSRYPLWDQAHIIRDVDEGRFYLPDAEERKRETLVTTPIDAVPVQCLRVPGDSFLPMIAAIFTGGLFIFATFYWYVAAAVSGVLAVGVILYWLWIGSARIPEKPEKDVGLGLTLPLYASGPASVGWWAMLITMLGDLTAFVGLVFGYFFYWTIREEFPPADAPDLRPWWPVVSAALFLASWLLTIGARGWNRGGRRILFHGSLGFAALLAIGGSAALVWSLREAGLDPEAHAYAAIVWTLVIWVALHAAAGVLMQLYCMARAAAGYLTPAHDIDIVNVALYWHFATATALVTVAVIAGFPAVRG